LAEAGANKERVKQLAADKGLKTTRNVAAGVAGIFIPVLWFGMDFQGTADTEITAPQSRQQYLSIMADQKRCGTGLNRYRRRQEPSEPQSREPPRCRPPNQTEDAPAKR